MTWEAIDWERRRITTDAAKTQKRRIVPIEAELNAILLSAFEAAVPGEKLVVPMDQVNRGNRRVRFHVILKRAGLTPWKDCFQVLRRNCETDWADTYPQHVVSTWIGHDITVSAKHYLQVPEELYAKVAGIQTGTKSAAADTNLQIQQCRRPDSNRGPRAYESLALTS